VKWWSPAARCSKKKLTSVASEHGETLAEGMEMQGIVRTVVDWGAFVALPEADIWKGSCTLPK
jgi:hypothetical protein